MGSFLGLLLHVLASPFKSQAQLEAAIVFLPHQLNLLRRRLPAKPRLTLADRSIANPRRIFHMMDYTIRGRIISTQRVPA
jgi:hypothetical protein